MLPGEGRFLSRSSRFLKICKTGQASDPAPGNRSSAEPRSPKSSAGRTPARASETARPAPSRGSSTRFGRILGPLGTGEGEAEPNSSITVEPRSDPAAEAAIKRRIEKQIQETAGDRARSIEVRVTGRTVVIRAQAARFWQRRSLRKSLETMPLPAGYRAKVEMPE